MISSTSIQDDDDLKETADKIVNVSPELREGTPSIVDDFIEGNLDTDADLYPTFLSKLLDDLAQ